MPEDPRILTRAKVDFMLGVGIDTMEDAQKFFDHDLAQRERIATLEAERDQAQISARDSQRLLNEVNHELAALEADNRRLFEHVIAISTTAGNRSISEMELRAKIIGVCHSALQPAAPQLSGEAGEKE